MLTQQLRKKANTAQLSAQEQGLYDILLNLSEAMEEQVMETGSEFVTGDGTLDVEVVAEEASQKEAVYKRYDKVAHYLAGFRCQDIISREIERRIEQHEQQRLRKSLQPEWKPNK